MTQLFHVVAGLLLLLLTALLLRSMWRLSRPVTILAAAVAAARLSLGVTMYFISKWNLALLAGVHSGDGYWSIGQDSATYYQLAVAGITEGLWSIPFGSPSPSYVRTLVVWMAALGASPLTALAFNTWAYLLMVWVLVRTCRAHQPTVPARGLLLMVVALSISPSLTVSSTQILKDVFFAALLVIFVVTSRHVLPEARRLLLNAQVSPLLLGGWAALLAIILVVSGVRPYFGVFLILALGLALSGWTFRRPWQRVAPRVMAVLIIIGSAWGAFAVGAGAYYEPYGRIVADAAGRAYAVTGLSQLVSVGSSPDSPEHPRAASSTSQSVAQRLDSARQGFVASGGNSNIATAESSQESTDLQVERGAGAWGRLRSVALGLAVTFMPFSVLHPLGLLDVDLGLARTLLADVDTVFNLLSLGFIAAWLWTCRNGVTFDWPLAVLMLCAAAVSLLLVGYVVTNVGTLVRLRVPGMVMLWLLPLAVHGRRVVARASL